MAVEERWLAIVLRARGAKLAAMLVMLLLSPFGADGLDARIAEIVAKPSEEKWLSIPWRTNLAQARIDAQNSDRPIFMWIMNGHPMGCT